MVKYRHSCPRLENHRFLVEPLDSREMLTSLGLVPQLIDASTSWQEIVTADIDADGDVDVIGFGHSGLASYENADGVGTYALKQDLGLNAVIAVAVGDLDLDGDVDFAAAGHSERPSGFVNRNELYFFENLGDGTYEKKSHMSAVDTYISSLVVEDIDSDGNVELITSEDVGLNSRIAWYELVGNEFAVAGSRPTPVHGRLTVANVRDDGRPDLILNSGPGLGCGDHLLWYEDIEGAHFAGEEHLDFLEDPCQKAVIVDFDSDGDTDVVGYSDEELTWWENRAGSYDQVRRIGEFERGTVPTNGIAWPISTQTVTTTPC